MFDKSVNSWAVHEEPEGLIFKRICLWDEMPVDRASERLNGYVIRGMLQDENDLIMLLLKDGNYRLMKISTGEDINHIIRTIQMHPSDGHQIYKGFFDPDKIERNTRQIIE